MALMTVETARSTLLDSVLHGGGWTESDLDRAIIAAGEEFLRETDAGLTTTTIVLASGTKTINVTSSVTGFLVDDFAWAEISFNPVTLAPFGTVQRRHQGSSPTGRPTMIGFRSNSYALFDKETDAEYSLLLTHTQRLTTWTVGGEDAPTLATTLNIPEKWVYPVIWWGARGHLLWGWDGHQPQASVAMEKFEQIKKDAQPRFPGTRTGVRDANTVS